MSGTTNAQSGRAMRHPSDDASDRSLVERVQKGSHRAFAELVTLHDGSLRALAFRLLNDPERVEDALQESYLKAFRTIGRFRGDASVGTWLYRITHNTCLDELRRLRPIPVVEETFDLPSREPDPGDRVVAAMEVTELLGKLPEVLLATVVLVDGYGYDYLDASRLLQVPTGTVASRMSRARRRLRQAHAWASDAGEEAA